MLDKIKSLKNSIGSDRTKETAMKVIQELQEDFSGYEIKTGKTYFVSEWTWNPLTDGNIACVEKIMYKKEINGICTLATGSSCRTYFPWDLFDSEEECREMCNFKNSFGYDWERAVEDFRKQNRIPWDFKRCFPE